MDKYLIAVIRPSFEFCLRDADELKDFLEINKIKALQIPLQSDNTVCVSTEHGKIEFISRDILTDEHKVSRIIAGKRYTKLFGVSSIPDEFKPHVKSFEACKDCASWVLKKEKEYSDFTGLRCETCKNFPICSAKGDYAVTQARINEVLNLSEHFNKAELPCEYFTP